MKKALSIVLLAAATTSLADVETDLGEIGVTEISSTLTNTIVAVSYDDLGGGSGMVVSNLVKTTNLTVGDKLAIFNNGTYDTWTLADNGSGVKFWQKNDRTFTIGSDGTLTEGTGASAATTVKAVGTGLWLCRQNPTSSFYIYGKPVSSPTVTLTADEWTLVGNPTQTAADLTAKVTGLGNGSQICYVQENGALGYCTYVVSSKHGSRWTPTPPSLGAGQGVWIKSTAAATIQW